MVTKEEDSWRRLPFSLEGWNARQTVVGFTMRARRKTNEHIHVTRIVRELISGPEGESEMRKLMTSLLVLALMAIGVSTAHAQFTEFCSANTPVSANGVFNIDVSCTDSGGPGGIVVTGGYSCSCNAGEDLLPVIVEENTFFGGFVGGPFPTGWQTAGQTSASAVSHTFACVNKSSGEVKIVASCTVGSNASPCHNNDTCTDLSGQSGQSPCSAAGSNPTCQVCISCLTSAG